jgi:hypothetical protein
MGIDSWAPSKIYNHRLWLHWLAELVPWNRILRSIKRRNQDEDDFFFDNEAKKNKYTVFVLHLMQAGTKKNELFVPKLSKE